MLKRADQRLYRAKNAGRNCVIVDDDDVSHSQHEQPIS
jgi:hypothetical protein